MEEKNEEKPKGKSAIIAAYKAENPDTTEDPDDDTLYDFSDNRYNDLNGRYNDLDGKHKELSGANARLAEMVAKDPKLGAVLSLIAGEDSKSLPYAFSRVFGKDVFDLEGDALEEFEAGYQENLKDLAKSKELQEQADKNIEEYKDTLSQYGKDNELSEEEVSKIHDGVMEIADNMLMGIIPVQLIEWIHKGQNYDKDLQEAAITGEVEGRNQTISAKMKEKTSPTPIPDLGNGTGAGKNKKIPPKKKAGNSYYEQMEEVKL